jgi:uncharacterized protein YeaO (DUF488 family)
MKTNWHLCPDDDKWTWCPNEIDLLNIPEFPWSGKYCIVCDYFDYIRNELSNKDPFEEEKKPTFNLKDQLKSLSKFVKKIQKTNASKTRTSSVGNSTIESKLKVYTARIDSTDKDRLNITRKSGTPYGKCFAPSWNLLTRFKSKQEGKNEKKDEEVEFGAFKITYIEEMRSSFVNDNSAWTNLLLSTRVVLICYCVNHEICHRTILARDILPNYGAEYCGELKSEISDLSRSSDFHDSNGSGKSKKSKKSNNGQGSLF